MAPWKGAVTPALVPRIVRVILILVAVVCFVFGGFLVATYVTSSSTVVGEHTIILDDPPSKAEIATMDERDTTDRLIIPRLGLNVPLSSMSTYTRNGATIINPPRPEKAYVVRDWGHAGDVSDMTVIAMHSIRGRPDIPGSQLIDIDAQQATVHTGEDVIVANVRYRITKVHSLRKDTVATDDELWRVKPGTLLIVTCLQRSEGLSLNNIVIEAEAV